MIQLLLLLALARVDKRGVVDALAWAIEQVVVAHMEQARRWKSGGERRRLGVGRRPAVVVHGLRRRWAHRRGVVAVVEVAAVVDQLTARLPVDGTSHLAGAVTMTTAAETTSYRI